jgi:membrane associated rhomboid family serine protease
VEDILGPGKFLLFYLLCGTVAAFSQFVIDPSSTVPIVGASGAIAGVMGAYLVKFPHSDVKLVAWFILIFTFELPAWLMLIYWFGVQLLGGVESAPGAATGGTAFFAHVGGFIAGIVLVNTLGTRQRYWRRRDLSW